MRKSRTVFALILLSAVLFSQCLTAYAGNDKTVDLGAIWTTDAAGVKNNENHYPTIADVFLNGGPAGGSLFTDDHAYYVKVTTTNGDLVGSAFTVTPVNGSFRVCLSAIGANPGPGVYKVHVGIDQYFSTAKTDNFSLTGGNNADTGLLTIRKAITGQGYSTTQLFQVTITPPNGGVPIIGNVSVDHPYSMSLPLGTYGVAETGTVDGYTYISGNGDVTVTAAGAEVTLNNHYGDLVGTLTIRKSITGDAGSNPDQTFGVNVSGMGLNMDGTVSVNAPWSIPNLPAGTYTVSETGSVDNYAYVSGGGTVNLAVTGGETTLVNSYTAPKGILTIRKSITGEAGFNPAQTFDVNVSGMGINMDGTVSVNTPWSIPNLPVGTYTVSETGSVANYAFVSGGGTVSLAVTGGETTLVNSYTAPRGSLTIYKAMTGDQTYNPAQEFAVHVVGPNYDQSGAVSVNAPWTIPNLLPGVYTVTETGSVADYAYVSGNSDITLSPNGGSVTITNSYTAPKGILTIRKSITGDQTFNADQQFTVTVTGNNVDFSGTVSVNHPWIIPNLLPGAYVVTETGSVSNYAYVSGGGTVNLAVTGGEVTLVNNYTAPKGALTINKSITGDPSFSASQEFTVNVAGMGVNLNGVVSASNPWIIPNLLPGTYAVTETGSVPNYAYVSGNGNVDLTVSGTSITLTNNYTAPKGALTIRKSITGDPSFSASQEFTVNVSGMGINMDGTVSVNTPWVIPNLLPGTYAVTETGSVLNYAYVSGNGNVDLTVSGTSVTLTNNYTAPKGALTIRKSISGDAGFNPAQTFGVNVSGMGINMDGTVSVNTPWSIPNLPVGTYTVSETGSVPNYAFVSGGGTVNLAVTGGETTLVNSYTAPKGILTIRKSITGEAGFNPAQTFGVNVSGMGINMDGMVSVNTPWSIPNLPVGTYTVSETGSVANYAFVSGGGTVNLAVTGGETTLVNSYTAPRGSLTIYKAMTGDQTYNPAQEFAVHVVGPNYDQFGAVSVNASWTIPNLLPGVYTVTETGSVADYAYVSGNSDITLSPNGGSVTITNSYTAPKGTLTIRKSITGDQTFNADQQFTVTVTGNNVDFSGTVSVNHPWTIPNLLPGAYVVTETGSVSNYAYVSGGGTVNLAVTGGEVTLINNYTAPRGTLTINKSITGDPSFSASQEFTVNVAGMGVNLNGVVSASNPWIIPNLLPGTYAVTETGSVSNYAYVSGNGNVDLTVSGTSITLTNNYTAPKGALTILKNITGDRTYNANQQFAVTVVGNGVNLTGVVSANNPWVIPNLLPGTYAVTETGSVLNYAYVSGNGNVDLTVSGTSVTLTNNYTAPKGTLTVRKSITGEAGFSPAQTFGVNVSGMGLNMDGTVSVNTPWSIPNLPVGTYTVSETGSVPNYAFVSGGGTVNLAVTGGETTLVNSYTAPKGILTIQKQIIGDTGWDPNQTFPVTITELVDGEVTPLILQGTVSVNHPWTTPLPFGNYHVAEGGMPSSRYSYVSISGEGGVELGSSATVTITNRYTSPTPPPPPPTNYPPVAIDDQADTLRETPVTIAVLLNDSDPDGDPLSITGASTPGHGTAIVTGSQITYTPAAGFIGTDTFTYTITDGHGHTATATVTVDVGDIEEPIPGGPTEPPEEPIPGGPTVLPKTGGINPLAYCGVGLALAAVGFVLRKRK